MGGPKDLPDPLLKPSDDMLRAKIRDTLIYHLKMPGEAAVRAAIHLDHMLERDGYVFDDPLED